VIDPRHLELADISRRDLRQWREAHAAGIVAVGRPFLRGIGGLCKRPGACQNQESAATGKEGACKSLHIHTRYPLSDGWDHRRRSKQASCTRLKRPRTERSPPSEDGSAAHDVTGREYSIGLDLVTP